MDSIRIRGGRPLEGEIEIFGAKNAALPLMAACLLTDETLTLANIPHLTDIMTLAHLLAQHGVEIGMDGRARRGGNAGRVLSLRARQITSTTAPYELVSRMRASILVLGPLLARTGRATVSLPGGCAIGTRPVDLHIDGLTRLGAEVVLEDGDIRAHAQGRLRGAEIRLPFASVGATENLMMAATLADGETVIRNAAREPEIADLALCLNAMGADITGIGTDELLIRGKESLSGAVHHVVGDRIEAGTYALAAAIVGGDIELAGAPAALLRSLVDYLEATGVSITVTPRGLRVRGNGRPSAADVTTRPYPGFPTDLQAQAMALMTVADGAAMITETIFENRFMHVQELRRMGADIAVRGGTALVRGVSTLTGAQVMATDLRASSSLVLAGLAAAGETVVHRVYHLDRGYERIEDKLAACGAEIDRVHH
ncbi:MAG: UDP-N-acetylglucosamine 1-carboxyvinyltransferase [Rhodospirillales bacterium]|nr:UDP-N-acetylglucosamine 1-carboxyvinyltransferase [Rhodospirillales bacterium]